MTSGGGGSYYWFRNDEETKSSSKIEGIVVVFAWGPLQECQLKNYVRLYSSLGWKSLVVLSDFLNPFFPERATSLAFSVLNKLLEELRGNPCPLVLAAFSGASQACMYKFFQIIEGTCEVHLNLDDRRLMMTCISGQIYDSGPVNVTDSSKFGSQWSEYWQTLYSSVGLEAPFLILCSENDDLAPYTIIRSFTQQIEGLGGHVQVITWKDSPHLGHYKHNPIEYRAAVTEFLDHSILIFNQKQQKLGEKSGTQDKICDLICDLQNAAVDSNHSLRRVAMGPNDHFFLPSSTQYQNKERRPAHLASPPSLSTHSVLGQVLFDACVAKNIYGWDIKFDGSLIKPSFGPFTSGCKGSSSNVLKRMRSRL